MSRPLEHLLAIDFEEPAFSAAFVEKARAMGLSGIRSVYGLTLTELTARPGFTYLWLTELTEYLEANGGMELLQPFNGRNHDRSG